MWTPARKRDLAIGQALGGDKKELPRRRKGDPQKAKLARRLRRETTLSLKWIVQRLPMGSRTCVSNLLKEESRHRCVNREHPTCPNTEPAQ
jgi:hypothetical protein